MTMIQNSTINGYTPGFGNKPIIKDTRKTPLDVAKNFAGIVENIAYGAGLKAGGLNIRNDGQLSRAELMKAHEIIKKANPAGGSLVTYLLNNFNSLDKKTSVILPNGGGTLPPNSKLSHNELVTSMQLRKDSMGRLIANNPGWGTIIGGQGIYA